MTLQKKTAIKIKYDHYLSERQFQELSYIEQKIYLNNMLYMISKESNKMCGSQGTGKSRNYILPAIENLITNKIQTPVNK